jgi:inositol phosphorylceramide mannosyltransferase catalytic subunit
MIPKIIHQTFPTTKVPPAIERNIETLKLSQRWDYRFYDDAAVRSFIAERYDAEMLRRFDSINPAYGAARADLFRYLLMYEVGGLYLDIKSSVTASLSAILREDDEYLISQWTREPRIVGYGFGQFKDLAHVPGGEFQQWFIAARPKHPFLKAVIERVSSNIDNYSGEVGKVGVIRTTGPIAYTLAIAPILDQHPHRRIKAHESHLRYNILDNADLHAHRLLFKPHYSTLTTPIILKG